MCSGEIMARVNDKFVMARDRAEMIGRSLMIGRRLVSVWIDVHAANWILHAYSVVVMMGMVLSAAATRVGGRLAFTARTRFFV